MLLFYGHSKIECSIKPIDFGSDPDTRKSMTGYLMFSNGGTISWRSSRYGGVTLNISEVEFVPPSHTGQETVHLRDHLKGFGHPQKNSTEIWEDNTSCTMVTQNWSNVQGLECFGRFDYELRTTCF